MFNPLYGGSGGGGNGKTGSGGGIVYVEAFLLAVINGRIGADGILESNNSFLGGASGGAIQIHTEFLLGNGTVSSSGSHNKGHYGGIGAGGRIKINLTNWYTYHSNNEIQFLVIPPNQ
jgi:hypothetical protein